MRGHSTETVLGDGLPNFKRAGSAISAISHGGWKEKRASGPAAPGGRMSGTEARCGQEPGPTQHRSPPIQVLAPLGCAVSQVVKTTQSRERTERTLLFAGVLAGRSTASRDRRNAADRLDPSLLMSRYCLLRPTHHADKR
jgi:hypothetical protein